MIQINKDSEDKIKQLNLINQTNTSTSTSTNNINEQSINISKEQNQSIEFIENKINILIEMNKKFDSHINKLMKKLRNIKS